MKVKNSLSDAIKNALCIVILIGVFVYLLLNWNQLPDRIPGHYNAAGVIDRWAAKGELLFCPVIALLLYAAMTWLERFPQIWNTGVTVTAENKDRVYRTLKSMLVTEKFITVAMFGYLCITQTTSTPLGGWFLPLSLGFVFGSIIFYIVKLNKIK